MTQVVLCLDKSKIVKVRHLGKLYQFIDHPRLGPIKCTNDGEPTAKQPAPSSDFWTVVQSQYYNKKQD